MRLFILILLMVIIQGCTKEIKPAPVPEVKRVTKYCTEIKILKVELPELKSKDIHYTIKGKKAIMNKSDFNFLTSKLMSIAKNVKVLTQIKSYYENEASRINSTCVRKPDANKIHR